MTVNGRRIESRTRRRSDELSDAERSLDVVVKTAPYGANYGAGDGNLVSIRLGVSFEL